MKHLIDKDGNYFNYLEFNEYKDYLTGEISSDVLHHWERLDYNFSTDIFPVLLTNGISGEERAVIALTKYNNQYLKYYNIPETKENIEKFITNFDNKIKILKASENKYGKYVFSVVMVHDCPVAGFYTHRESKIMGIFTSYDKAYQCVKNLNERIIKVENNLIPITDKDYSEELIGATLEINKLVLDIEPECLCEDEDNYPNDGIACFCTDNTISYMDLVVLITENYDYPQCFNIFIDYPSPFKAGDIVKEINSNRIGLVASAHSKDFMYKDKNKVDENSTFNENQIKVDFISPEDKQIYSELVHPIKLEYYKENTYEYRVCKKIQLDPYGAKSSIKDYFN